MAPLDVKPYDAEQDVMTIEGIRYSGELFRELGFSAQVGQLLRVVERTDGVVTLVREEG